MKETNNKNSCCSQIQKYFCAALKLLLFFVLRIRTNKNILTHFPFSGMTPKDQTVQGEQGLLKLGK
jgi:hypothetical protein